MYVWQVLMFRDGGEPVYWNRRLRHVAGADVEVVWPEQVAARFQPGDVMRYYPLR